MRRHRIFFKSSVTGAGVPLGHKETFEDIATLGSSRFDTYCTNIDVRLRQEPWRRHTKARVEWLSKRAAELFEDVNLGLVIRIDEPEGGAAPPSRRRRQRNLLQPLRRVKLFCRERSNGPPIGSVDRYDFSITDVVPVVERHKISLIGYQRIHRTGREFDIGVQAGGQPPLD